MVSREHERIRRILAELQFSVVWKSEKCSGRGVGLYKDFFFFFFLWTLLFDSPCLCNMPIYLLHLLIDVCVWGAECLFMMLHNQGSFKESKAHQPPNVTLILTRQAINHFYLVLPGSEETKRR